MQRNEIVDRIRAEKLWDMVVIGGGATGLGTALDAATRGYRTLLVDSHDFAKGTSSRSTKLIHGGVRYLAQGRIGLVRQALRERQVLRQIAPDLVHDRAFLIPAYRWWEAPYYNMGLKAYDILAGSSRWAWSRQVSLRETLELASTLEPKNLRGGVVYRDGQFDDARMAMALLATFVEQGGTALNYAGVVRVLHENDKIAGVVIRDTETGEELVVPARSVVNATGVFADFVRGLDDPKTRPMIAPSQGLHLVLDRSFLPGDTAVLIPKTADGRVLFAIPWLGKVVLGTTDTPVAAITMEPRGLPEEIEFLLSHAAKYLGRRPEPSDVKSVYAGLRPLIGHSGEKTAKLSREHLVLASQTGMVTITGGKWTTYRVMARDAVDRAAKIAGLPLRPCRTEFVMLKSTEKAALIASDRQLGQPIHPNLPYVAADVVYGIRREQARTVEDILARRTRSLLLDATASAESAEVVAAILAKELGQDAAWQAHQVEQFRALAATYQYT